MVTTICFPLGSGVSSGRNSLTFPQTDSSNSCDGAGMDDISGSSVLNLIAVCLNLTRHPIALLALSKCPFRGSAQKEARVAAAVFTSSLPNDTAH